MRGLWRARGRNRGSSCPEGEVKGQADRRTGEGEGAGEDHAVTGVRCAGYGAGCWGRSADGVYRVFCRGELGRDGLAGNGVTGWSNGVGLTSGAVQRSDGFRLWLYPSYVLRCGIPLRRHGSRLSAVRAGNILGAMRTEEHTSELQSLM